MSDWKLELTGYFAFIGYCWIILACATASPIMFLSFIELIKKLK